MQMVLLFRVDEKHRQAWKDGHSKPAWRKLEWIRLFEGMRMARPGEII